ncbi:MAG: hypothetical protein K1X83_04920 [Oligoflexia bacterium]|nr:hypothetical protein [Oligoflexia bacterium]
MDQSKALHQLIEASDLIGMLEALTSNQSVDALGSSPWAGLRITLRHIKEMIHNSHDVLAADLVNRARARMESAAAPAPQPSAPELQSSSNQASRQTTIIENGGIKLQRKDLRAQLEKFVDR